MVRSAWRIDTWRILGVAFNALIGHSLANSWMTRPWRKRQLLPCVVLGSGFLVGNGSGAPKRRQAPRYFDCWLQSLTERERIASVSGWARDVTAQYESEIRFNELFESLREGVFFATLDGQILDANPAMIQLSATPSKEELQAHNLRELYPNPDDRQLTLRGN